MMDHGLTWWRPRKKETRYESNPTADRRHWRIVIVGIGVWFFLITLISLILLSLSFLANNRYTCEPALFRIVDNGIYGISRNGKPYAGLRVVDANATMACQITIDWWKMETEFRQAYPIGRDKIPGWIYQNSEHHCYLTEWNYSFELGKPSPYQWITTTLVLVWLCCASFWGAGLLHACIQLHY